MVKAATTGSATILILEDEELILEEIQESLEFEGYATIGARSIKEAWENKCAYCDSPPISDESLTIDHVKPRSRGGQDCTVM